MGMNKIRAMFDGCCEPKNPSGHIGAGAIVYVNAKVEATYSDYVPEGPTNSNNVAEYMGLIFVLKYIMAIQAAGVIKIDRIDIRGDSNLVINQMNGEWKIKKGFYISSAAYCLTLFREVQSASVRAGTILTLQWHPREMNEEADALSKKLLIEKGIKFKIQPNN